jgi:hypothetical protein
MSRRIHIAAFLAAFPFAAAAPTGGADAQDFMPHVRERIAIPAQYVPPQQRDDTVRVQVNLNLFMPGTTEGDEGDRLRESARRMIYKYAQHECDLLREVLAKDCRLQTINVNIMRQANANAAHGFNVSGALGLQITTKDTAPPR